MTGSSINSLFNYDGIGNYFIMFVPAGDSCSSESVGTCESNNLDYAPADTFNIVNEEQYPYNSENILIQMIADANIAIIMGILLSLGIVVTRKYKP